nr:Zinc finger domain containing protein [Haemonchus contortus]
MPRKRRGKRHVYHYDEENGLLEEIVKVTSPPGKPKAVKRYEKPSAATVAADWNSVNRTYCVVCREGGELLCCDVCPASFHLLCHEPIIRREKIPRGRWLCNRCRRSGATAAAKRSHASFDVPPSIRIDGLTPYGLMPYKGLAQPRQIIIDEPCVICEGIGEESPKIQCDFCKYVYHVDCLQFPLCSPPSEAWMCPNHVEPIVDLKLLNSISFTERRRIWLRYARQPVNEMEIRKNFVEKVVSNHKGLSDCLLKNEISLKKKQKRSIRPIAVLVNNKEQAVGWNRQTLNNSEYLKKESESDGEQMRRFPKCFDGSVIVPGTRPTRQSSNTVSNCVEVSGLAEVSKTVSEAFSSAPSQASKKPDYSSPFCAAILPKLDNRMNCGSQLYSHDRVYSVMLPYRTDEQQGSHFVHVDFGLDEGNCSLDCRSFSTDEDLCHSPIVIPNRSENVASAPLLVDTPSSPLTLDPCCQEIIRKRNESNHQIPSIDITPTIKMLDAGRGSLLRALLDGTDGVSHVEPAIEKQRFIMQRTRQPKKFAVKSKT